MKESNDFIRVRKTTNGLVFCQAITILLGPIRSDISSRPKVAVIVSRLGAPPSAGITYTSVLPSYCDVNAICEPSGENRGNDVYPGPLVRRRAMPPSLPTV